MDGFWVPFFHRIFCFNFFISQFFVQKKEATTCFFLLFYCCFTMFLLLESKANRRTSTRRKRRDIGVLDLKGKGLHLRCTSSSLKRLPCERLGRCTLLMAPHETIHKVQFHLRRSTEHSTTEEEWLLLCLFHFLVLSILLRRWCLIEA